MEEKGNALRSYLQTLQSIIKMRVGKIGLDDINPFPTIINLKSHPHYFKIITFRTKSYTS